MVITSEEIIPGAYTCLSMSFNFVFCSQAYEQSWGNSPRKKNLIPVPSKSDNKARIVVI